MAVARVFYSESFVPFSMLFLDIGSRMDDFYPTQPGAIECLETGHRRLDAAISLNGLPASPNLTIQSDVQPQRGIGNLEQLLQGSRHHLGQLENFS